MSTTKLRKYIREEPQRPKGTQNRIPILVSDSKGLTLRNYCQDFKFPFELWCLPGARTKKLADLIKERTEKALQRHRKILIYLWAGTCDKTKKCGKEIRLRNKDNTTNDNITKEYERIIKYLEQYGSDVIIKIVDLPVLSIEKRNTKHLKNIAYKEDGVHPGKNISLVITKLLLLDSYTECFISVPSEDILQIRIEEEVLLKLSLS